MAKRFMDNTVFERQWFRQLPIKLKIVWFYLINKCNHAGIWECDIDLLSFQIGKEYTLKEILEAFGNNIIELGDNKYYLTDKGILNIKKPYSTKPVTTLKIDYDDLKVKYDNLKASNDRMYKHYRKLWNKVYSGPTDKQLNDAIEYYFVNAFVEELTTDKFFYAKILLDKAAALTGCKLNWNSINHYSLNRKDN